MEIKRDNRVEKAFREESSDLKERVLEKYERIKREVERITRGE